MLITADKPTVTELLQQRKSGQSDDYHLALSVEGGLIRGAISAGMIEALDAAGAGQYFDSFWGTSIGALNAAYLAAGETAGRAELYAQAVEGGRSGDPRRSIAPARASEAGQCGPEGAFLSSEGLLRLVDPGSEAKDDAKNREPSGGLYRRRPRLDAGWLDLDWLFDHGFDCLQPLPWERLPGSKLRFLVTSSRWWEAREAVSYFRPQTGANYRQLLQAACQAPLATGLPIGARRRQLWDAAVFENWPQATVWKHGATHLLVLRATPMANKETLPWRAYSRAFNWLFCTPSYQQQEGELQRLITIGRAAAVTPAEQLIALHESDSQKVRAAVELGREAFERFWQQLGAAAG